MHELASKPGGLALDYIHRNLMQPSELGDQSSALLRNLAILTGAMTVRLTAIRVGAGGGNNIRKGFGSAW